MQLEKLENLSQIIVLRLQLTSHSTLRLKEKREERGSGKTLYAIIRKVYEAR